MEKRLQRQRSLSYLKSFAVYLFLFFNTLVLPMIAALWIEDTFGDTAAVCTAGFLFLSTWYGFGTNEKITAFLKNESSFRYETWLEIELVRRNNKSSSEKITREDIEREIFYKNLKKL